jgi:glutamate synthase (NADPH/NADH) small chain
MLLKAIGQNLDTASLSGLDMDGGKLQISEDYQTSQAGVFAGGDCVHSGEDLTVQSVEDGKQAAIAVNAWLKNSKGA